MVHGGALGCPLVRGRSIRASVRAGPPTGLL